MQVRRVMMVAEIETKDMALVYFCKTYLQDKHELICANTMLEVSSESIIKNTVAPRTLRAVSELYEFLLFHNYQYAKLIQI